MLILTERFTESLVMSGYAGVALDETCEAPKSGVLTATLRRMVCGQLLHSPLLHKEARSRAHQAECQFPKLKWFIHI